MLVKKILCPIDLSTDTKRGMAYAIFFAQESRAEVIFLHVMRFSLWRSAYTAESDASVYGIVAPGFSLKDRYEQAMSRAERLVLANFGRDVMGVNWKVVINLGNVAREIVNVAAAEKADLVIMARRKRGIWRRPFTRRISEVVSDLAHCPVLMIHEEI